MTLFDVALLKTDLKLHAALGVIGGIDDIIIVFALGQSLLHVVEGLRAISIWGIRTVIDITVDEGDVLTVFINRVRREILPEALNQAVHLLLIVGITGIAFALMPEEAADDRLLAAFFD